LTDDFLSGPPEALADLHVRSARIDRVEIVLAMYIRKRAPEIMIGPRHGRTQFHAETSMSKKSATKKSRIKDLKKEIKVRKAKVEAQTTKLKKARKALKKAA
jgi:hypothetical protein